MTQAVQGLLNSFDSLSDAEKQEAAAEILRRLPTIPGGDMPETALVAAADELFQALDQEEARHADP